MKNGQIGPKMRTGLPALRCQRSNATLERAQRALEASARRLKRLEMREKELRMALMDDETSSDAAFEENPESGPCLNTGISVNPSLKVPVFGDLPL